MAIVTFAECFIYAKCRKQVRYAEWHYAKCRYPDCHGAARGAQFWRRNIWPKANRPNAKKPKVLNFLYLLLEAAFINLSVDGSTYSG